MTIFLTVLITLVAIVWLALWGLLYFRDDIAKQRSQIEAWHRAWQVQQVEYDTDQRLRDATRDAMNQMLDEIRRHEGGGRG
ncbi:MAG: DUF3810 domain-containing protein [Micrococcales bacterium]|nr:DUF3810 domain-containing protein [Micrococcales bacterium]